MLGHMGFFHNGAWQLVHDDGPCTWEVVSDVIDTSALTLKGCRHSSDDSAPVVDCRCRGPCWRCWSTSLAKFRHYPDVLATLRPPSTPWPLMSAVAEAPLLWTTCPCGQPADTTGQLWDHAYRTAAAGSLPVWLVRRPRVELVRLLSEEWLDVGGARVSGGAPLALELGCGLGRDALFLAEQGFRVVGVDFSDFAVDEARRESEERGISSCRAQFFACDVYDLPPCAQPAALVYDNSVFARAACDPNTMQTADDYRSLLRRLTCTGSYVFLQVMAEEFALKQNELRDIGIPLTRVSAAQLVAEFEDEFEIIFLRSGVFCFNDLFSRAAQSVGWDEPAEIGGHPGWALLLRRSGA